MTYMAGQSVYRDAIVQRFTNVPFTHMSVHRIREGSENLHYECRVVEAIAQYHRASKWDQHPSMLISCVPEDAHIRLQRIPDILERELGYNLVGAMIMLPELHGVAKSEVNDFRLVVRPEIDRLRRDCEEARTILSGPIKQEYKRLAAGTSILPRLCAKGADIGDKFDAFCVQRGLLFPQP